MRSEGKPGGSPGHNIARCALARVTVRGVLSQTCKRLRTRTQKHGSVWPRRLSRWNTRGEGQSSIESFIGGALKCLQFNPKMSSSHGLQLSAAPHRHAPLREPHVQVDFRRCRTICGLHAHWTVTDSQRSVFIWRCRSLTISVTQGWYLQ